MPGDLLAASALLTGASNVAGGLVIAGIAAFGSWRIARRKASGRIDTSDATDLWAESRAMRAEMRAENDAKDREIAELRRIVTGLREAVARSEAQLINATQAIRDLLRVAAEHGIPAPETAAVHTVVERAQEKD